MLSLLLRESKYNDNVIDRWQNQKVGQMKCLQFIGYDVMKMNSDQSRWVITEQGRKLNKSDTAGSQTRKSQVNEEFFGQLKDCATEQSVAILQRLLFQI